MCVTDGMGEVDRTRMPIGRKITRKCGENKGTPEKDAVRGLKPRTLCGYEHDCRVKERVNLAWETGGPDCG